MYYNDAVLYYSGIPTFSSFSSTSSSLSSYVLQRFTSGAVNTSKGVLSLQETLSGFPSFQVQDPDEKLGFLSYGGDMVGYTDRVISTYVFHNHWKCCANQQTNSYDSTVMNQGCV